MVRFDLQVQMDHSHLMDVLLACTNETDIALQTLRLNEELDLYAASKMYAKALEVSRCLLVLVSIVRGIRLLASGTV